MLKQDIFEDSIPRTNEPITVITEYNDTGLLIQDYQMGEPLNDGIYYSAVDFDDAILTYNYRENVWVEASAEPKFKLLCDLAQLFISCGRNFEKYLEALDEMEREERELAEFDIDINYDDE